MNHYDLPARIECTVTIHPPQCGKTQTSAFVLVVTLNEPFQPLPSVWDAPILWDGLTLLEMDKIRKARADLARELARHFVNHFGKMLAAGDPVRGASPSDAEKPGGAS